MKKAKKQGLLKVMRNPRINNYLTLFNPEIP